MIPKLIKKRRVFHVFLIITAIGLFNTYDDWKHGIHVSSGFSFLAIGVIGAIFIYAKYHEREK